MTAFRDAFEKAGMNTAGAELFKLATDALRNHGGSADKAVGKFSHAAAEAERPIAYARPRLPSPCAVDMAALRRRRSR